MPIKAFQATLLLFGIDVSQYQITVSDAGVLAQESAFMIMDLPWYLQRFAKVVWSNDCVTATYKCVKSAKFGPPKVERVMEKVV